MMDDLINSYARGPATEDIITDKAQPIATAPNDGGPNEEAVPTNGLAGVAPCFAGCVEHTPSTPSPAEDKDIKTGQPQTSHAADVLGDAQGNVRVAATGVSDEEREALVKAAGDLKQEGNALFAAAAAAVAAVKAGGSSEAKKASELYYAAKAKYTKIRLYTDSLDLPNAHDPDAFVPTTTKPMRSKQLRQVRAIRYCGDLNSALCSFKIAQLIPADSESGSERRHRELRRALEFAERAVRAPPLANNLQEPIRSDNEHSMPDAAKASADAKPSMDAKASSDVKAMGADIDRTKAIFWRGKLRCLLGDVDGAEQDLQEALTAYSNPLKPRPLARGAVQSELQKVEHRKQLYRQKEKLLFGGWLNSKKSTSQ